MLRIRLKETGTSPLIIHGNGNAGKLENGAFEWIRRNRKPVTRRAAQRDDLTIVSWKGGKLEGKETMLERSAAKFGYPVLLLPWQSKHGFAVDTQQKVTRTLEAILNGRITSRYVLFLDCGDILFLDSPTIALERFLTLGTRFLWNGERNLYPLVKASRVKDISKAFVRRQEEAIASEQAQPGSFRFLNAGGGIGETHTLLEMLQRAERLFRNTQLMDQAALRIVRHEMRDTTRVDRNCDLFLCCWGVFRHEIELLD